MVTLCQNIKSGRILKMPKYFSHLEPLAKSDGRHFSGKSGEHAGRHHGGAPSPTRGQSSAGPNGIKNFNPGIFRDGILPNPGIPGFSNIFDPGILGKFSGFSFLLYLLVKLDHFFNPYHHHFRHHLLCTSATVL